MKRALSFLLALLMAVQLMPAAQATDVANQIAAIPLGTPIEVQLKDQQILRGARGKASDSSFYLVNRKAGDRQIAFADVISVKAIKKSRAKRNALIIGGVIVGVAVVVVVTFVILVKTKSVPI